MKMDDTLMGWVVLAMGHISLFVLVCMEHIIGVQKNYASMLFMIAVNND